MHNPTSLFARMKEDVKSTVNGMVERRRVTGFDDRGRVRTADLDPDISGEELLVFLRPDVRVGDDVVTIKAFGKPVVLGALRKGDDPASSFATQPSAGSSSDPGTMTVTSEFIRNTMAAALRGDGITIMPNDAADTITLGRPGTTNVKTHGAVGDGVVDDSAAFLAAVTAVYTSRVTPAVAAQAALGTTKRTTLTIDLPPGNFRITQLNGLLGREAPTEKVNGLRFRGAGAGITNIIFDPATDGALCTNNYWLNIGFTGIAFVTLRAGATFMNSHTTHNAQKYSFIDCFWAGAWKHGFHLQGADNNSEYTFLDCGTEGMANDGSFLHVPSTNALGTPENMDQFLNYWFYSFKHWSTGAAVIDMARGGHVHIHSLDASDWGASLTAPRYLFNLRGASHAQGVCTFEADGVRVEAKHATNARLLYSEWPQGTVTLECDWTSQRTVYTYGEIITLILTNVSGPTYRFHDSELAGKIGITYGTDQFATLPIISVENTTWYQQLTMSEAVTYVDPAAAGSWNNARPTVTFDKDCRGEYADLYGAGGLSVWHGSVGNGSPAIGPRDKQNLRISGLMGTTPNRINFPIGAIITGFSAIAPAGVMAEADTQGWTLATTDTTPVTIASVVSPGAASAGYRVTQQLSIPFLCNTRARATVTVTPNSVTSHSYDAMVLIEGYW